MSNAFPGKTKSRLQLWLIAGLCFTTLGGAPSAAIDSVLSGLSKFKDGKFVQADEDFAIAAKAAPGNHRIAFNRGCANASLKKVEAAHKHYGRAALSRDSMLSADSHFNSSILSSDAAREVFGDDPAGASKETREEGLSFLTTAIGHCRTALRVEPDHEPARHNLEVMRLWIKQMKAVWKERDKQQRRDEMNVFEFLAFIESEQATLRRSTEFLARDKATVQRQSLRATENEQRELSEEIGPLEDKILESLEQSDAANGANAANAQPGSVPGNASQSAAVVNAETARLMEQIKQVTAQIRKDMQSAADILARSEPESALTSQTSALTFLNELYMGIVPFPQLVSRGLKEQSAVLESTTAAAPLDAGDVAQSVDSADDSETAAAAKTTGEADNSPANSADDEQAVASVSSAIQELLEEPVTDVDQKDLSWRQQRLTSWASVLEPKAQQMLDMMNSQPPPTANPDSNPADGNSGNTPVPNATNDDNSPANDASQEQPDFRPALERAIELAPELLKASRQPVPVLRDAETWKQFLAAVPPEKRAREIWEEISKLLPQQDNKNQDQQQRQDPPQNQPQPPQPEDNHQQVDKDQPPTQQSQDKQDQQNKNPNNARKMSQNQAEALMRQARERQRKHQQQRERLRMLLAPPQQVDRDW